MSRTFRSDEIDFKEEAMKSPIEWDNLETYVRTQMESKVEYATELYKNYYLYNQDRKQDLIKDKEEWRFNIKSPLTYMFINTIYTMILDSDIRFVAIDRRGKYSKTNLVDEILDMWDYLFTTTDSKESLYSAIFDAILLWWWCYKIDYDNTNNTVKYKNKYWEYENISYKNDFPVMKYVSPTNLFVYWMARTIDSARMIIERLLIPSKDIEAQYKKYGLKLKKDKIRDEGIYIDTKDYEAIKINMPFFNTPDGRDIIDDETYDIKNKLLEVYEVHTKNTVTIFINWVDHWTFERFWPFSNYPYKVLSAQKSPWSVFAPGYWYVIKPLQDAYDALLNTRMDNVQLVMNKQFLMDSSASLFGNNNTIKIKPWLIHKVKDINAIKELDITEVKWSWYQEITQLFEMIQGLTWVSWPMMWRQDKVERTATGAELLKAAADRQRAPLLETVSKAMADTLKQFLVLSLSLMSDETFDRILWEDNTLKTLNPVDVLRDFDFNFEMTSMKSQAMSIEREQLLQAIQAIWPVATADGAPVLDVRPLVEKLLSTFWLQDDALLEPEEADELAIKWAERAARAEAAGQKIIMEAQQEMQPTEAWPMTEWNLQQLMPQ